MVIAIGGASRSGKTRLTTLLKELLPDNKVLTICQDDYVYPIAQIPRIRDRIDWECPRSINFDSLRKDLVSAMANYDHVIIEGFLVYHEGALNQYFDKSIFIQIDKNTFMNRRKEDTRWHDEPHWYLEYVWESYLKYGEVAQQHTCLNISGLDPIPEAEILEYIRA
jgi:uridine kinase